MFFLIALARDKSGPESKKKVYSLTGWTNRKCVLIWRENNVRRASVAWLFSISKWKAVGTDLFAIPEHHGFKT